MKAFAFLAFLTLFGVAGALSPVTRVVELLKDLSKKIEHESKVEEDLYETFVCWAKSMISQKTQSNAASTSRIDMLNAYIADLDAGRIELTTERQDLEKEIETLLGDIEVATETRDKEHEDYLEAKDEMDKAIAALEDALDVLRTATDGHENGVLLNLKGMMTEGASVRAAQAARLTHAVELGDKVLTKGDATFLRRVLTGEVPKADWKKLNRKATFKKSYKARSFKIQGVLAKLLETFSSNLMKATEAENEAKDLFDKLMLSKTNEKNTAQTALDELSGENGAKGMSRAESVAEVDKLTAEVTNDERYIGQVKQSLADKKQEWKDRKALRAGEIGAISKAISILHNDDARDLFKKSFSSQDQSKAFLFLQESSTETGRRASAAAKELRSAAGTTKDARLSQLAARLASKSKDHFDEVIGAIDTMLDLLKGEEASDLEKKEECEKDRAEDTRTAILAGRSIDEKTDAVSVLKTEIEELSKEIKDHQEEVARIEEELKAAKEMRDKEHAEYLVAKKDDEDAAEVVMNAKNVLESFYADNGLVFAQQVKKQPFESAAGEAPPPPPTTWEAPYGGKVGEQQGIVSVLGMIHEDILKDNRKAATEEQESLDMYTDTKKAMDDEVIDLNGMITDANSTKSGKIQDVDDLEGEKVTKKGELDAVMKKMEDANSFCEYFTVNYELRFKNRQIEMDGLVKAKAILQGGAFAKPADPNREMKPGDALVQAPKRNLRQVARH